MKTFIFILMSLGVAILLSACGLISTSSVDKELDKIATEYGGSYVFDKKFREEIIQREKERKEFRNKYLGEEIQVGNETHFVNFTYINKTLPQVLSNGREYAVDGRYYFEGIHHYPKFKKYVVEYMGEEVFKKLESSLIVTSYYIDEEKYIVPISVDTEITETITKYGLYGDEGAGFRFSDSYSVDISGDNIFYLENGRFIKSNEKRFGKAK